MTRQILVRYPKNLIAQIDKLVEHGEYSSRSDALKHAARILISKHQEKFSEIEKVKPGEELREQDIYKAHFEKHGFEL